MRGSGLDEVVGSRYGIYVHGGNGYLVKSRGVGKDNFATLETLEPVCGRLSVTYVAVVFRTREKSDLIKSSSHTCHWLRRIVG